jgi:hypothetical protein
MYSVRTNPLHIRRTQGRLVRPTSDDHRAADEGMVVEIAWCGGSVTVRSAPERDEAAWPRPSRQSVHLLTAWDPGLERPGHDVNRVRQAALEADLQRLGLPLFVAVGLDPVTRHRDEGVAVLGAVESQVLALGACNGRDAVFAWTPDEWAVVDWAGRRRLTSGWSPLPPSTGISLQPGI